MPITKNDFALTISLGLFIMGLICVGLGIFILIRKIFTGDLKEITDQTTELAQKGIADDVAGLVGNAASLIDSLNQLVKTTTGIAQFLIIVGLALLIIGFFTFQSIY